MKSLVILAISALFALTSALAALTPLAPESVAIVYNSDDPDSEELAIYYAGRRAIPKENLIGLPLAKTDSISRADYNTTLRDPLAKAFDDRGWWTRQVTPAGQSQITQQKIRVLLSVRGVPFGIQHIPLEDPKQKKPSDQTIQKDQAGVDSELTLLGHAKVELKSALNNPYFKNESSAATTNLQGLLLVARLDGPSLATCKRMVDDAIATEKEGLWGHCYLDLALKKDAYKIGDDWIEAIYKQNGTLGIPTVIDRNRDTFVTNYPMRNASLYYGWYTPHRNGPLLNEEFQFKRGAVAVHLHSFSATKLRSAKANWCGPILDKGAAATVGNVFEPFLQMTHHFDILHDRLTKGHSFVEAAYMAMPVLSWQGVVLGDPLYRPFAKFSGTDYDLETDRDYKALRTAWMRWPNDTATRTRKMRSAAARTNSGILYESLGLFLLQEGEAAQASAFFNSANHHYQHPADRLRQELHNVDLTRQAKRKQDAINHLRKIQGEYADIPEAKAIIGLLNILDPPAPPPAKPKAPTKP